MGSWNHRERGKMGKRRGGVTIQNQGTKGKREDEVVE